MPDAISITVNGTAVHVPPNTTALAAILMSRASSSVPFVRRSVTGEPRGPLCAMGVCFECRATINGQHHSRTCLILCAPGMDIRTDD
ncbi:MAG TPA: (2Fe-2S)-binding protein [Candidatus Acidoferrales bacterium]|nr:(2Fe-2S)-binding protein [Candidatus Acidoferrales bacterium]